MLLCLKLCVQRKRERKRAGFYVTLRSFGVTGSPGSDWLAGRVGGGFVSQVAVDCSRNNEGSAAEKSDVVGWLGHENCRAKSARNALILSLKFAKCRILTLILIDSREKENEIVEII